MSEAVIDEAIEQIADGLPVDWNALDSGRVDESASGPRACVSSATSSICIATAATRLRAAHAEETATAQPIRRRPRHLTPGAGIACRKGRRGQLRQRLSRVGSGARARGRDQDPASAGRRRDLRERLLQEGRALAKIQHTTSSACSASRRTATASACAWSSSAGRRSRTRCEPRHVTRARRTLIGEDVCRALSAVHRAGFVHRDVKARNVMRERHGPHRPDGLRHRARTRRRPQTARATAGTPLYMAPEVLEGEPASVRSDVYSVGVLLYHLVTGEVSGEGAHDRRAHDGARAGAPPAGSASGDRICRAVHAVVERAIALDADARYPNASEPVAALSGLRIGPRPWVWQLAKQAIAVAAVVVGMTLLGGITSTRFNIALQRSVFATDTVWDWLRWGRLSSVPPFLILLMVVLTAAVLGVVRRVVVVSSSAAARLDAGVRRRALAIGHRLRLDEVSVLASYALLLSLAAVTLAWWYFTPLILQLLAYIPAAKREDLQLLSPGSSHVSQLLSWRVQPGDRCSRWLSGYRLSNWCAKANRCTGGCGSEGRLPCALRSHACTCRSRLLIYRNLFEVVEWNGTRCSVIGENSSSYLLFSATFNPPRNRTVDRRAPGVRFVGAQEPLFSHFGAGFPN